MSNTDLCSPDTHSVTETVAKNDTSGFMPSIPLSRMPVTPTFSTQDAVEVRQGSGKLAAMEQARKTWESNELAASNKRLYAILKDAYTYYWVMKHDTRENIRKTYANELAAFCKERAYTFLSTTHDMTRVVKCVFGLDRRRVSAYSITLRKALRLNVQPALVAAFIEKNGGVEQIRTNGGESVASAKREGKVTAEVPTAALGLFKLDPVVAAGNPDWNDKEVVIVATYLPTGEFQAKAVVRHDGAVNAALSAYHKQQRANEREAKKAKGDDSDAHEATA